MYQRNRYGAQQDTIEVPEKDLVDKVQAYRNQPSLGLVPVLCSLRTRGVLRLVISLSEL